jgi:hypothetical protein
MASLRKRHSNADSDPPISTPPRAAEPASTQSPAPLPEAIKTASPADEAGKNAIQQRLSEMDNARRLSQQPQQSTESEPLAVGDEPQQLTVEQAISASGLPQRMQQWLREHSEFVTDPAKNAQLQKLHNVAEYQAGGEWTPLFFERLDELAGFKQPQPNGNGSAQRQAMPAPRPTPAPVRQQAPAVSYSAPPHRDVPTMRTGRSPSARTPLTQDELEVARSSGMTPEQYAKAKRMLTEQERIGPRARDGR